MFYLRSAAAAAMHSAFRAWELLCVGALNEPTFDRDSGNMLSKISKLPQKSSSSSSFLGMGQDWLWQSRCFIMPQFEIRENWLKVFGNKGEK